jgi:hypothetical protein
MSRHVLDGKPTKADYADCAPGTGWSGEPMISPYLGVLRHRGWNAAAFKRGYVPLSVMSSQGAV